MKFYKEPNGIWFADIPEWTGDKWELEMVAGADKFLDILAEGQDEIDVEFSTEPFENPRYTLNLKEEGNGSGTYEIIGTNPQFDLWLCHMLTFALGRVPPAIYVK